MTSARATVVTWDYGTGDTALAAVFSGMIAHAIGSSAMSLRSWATGDDADGGCPQSPAFRRFVRRTPIGAALGDRLVRRKRTGADRLSALVPRRFDDLAAGRSPLRGALRRRSSKCLKVRASRAR